MLLFRRGTPTAQESPHPLSYRILQGFPFPGISLAVRQLLDPCVLPFRAVRVWQLCQVAQGYRIQDDVTRSAEQEAERRFWLVDKTVSFLTRLLKAEGNGNERNSCDTPLSLRNSRMSTSKQRQA